MICANGVMVQHKGEVSEEAQRSGIVGLNNDQGKTLIKVLEETHGTDSTSRANDKDFSLDWVLETEASNHINGYEDIISDSKYILPCTIGFSMVKKACLERKEWLCLMKGFCLKNVLFVPDLKCNLISVSQLIADFDLLMQIANKGCMIHDRLKRSLTGVDELKDELYFFHRLTSFMIFI